MNKLIDALRYCADEDKICTRQTHCGYYGKGFFCQDVLMIDAADAIEKLVAERKQLRDDLIRRICQHFDSRMELCEECPIIQEVNGVFKED